MNGVNTEINILLDPKHNSCQGFAHTVCTNFTVVVTAHVTVIVSLFQRINCSYLRVLFLLTTLGISISRLSNCILRGFKLVLRYCVRTRFYSQRMFLTVLTNTIDLKPYDNMTEAIGEPNLKTVKTKWGIYVSHIQN